MVFFNFFCANFVFKFFKIYIYFCWKMYHIGGEAAADTFFLFTCIIMHNGCCWFFDTVWIQVRFEVKYVVNDCVRFKCLFAFSVMFFILEPFMSSCAIRRIAYVLLIFFKCCYILCRLGAEDPQSFRVVSRFAESPMLRMLHHPPFDGVTTILRAKRNAPDKIKVLKI